MKFQSIALVSILGGLVASASANLVTNGSFETHPAFAGTSYYVVNAGSTDLTGWTVGGKSIDITGIGYPVHSGAYAVDLAGTPGPGSVSQSLATSGTQYTVSFWATGGSYPNDVVNVSFGSTSASFVVTGGWAQYSFTTLGNVGSTNLTLATRPENGTTGNIFIDDVSVEAVPEPMTMVALSCGLIAIARKRRK
jgi:hypothetical protein